MRPVCVKCGREMKCVKTGQLIQEVGHGEFGFRSGDRFQCAGCKNEVVVNCGDRYPLERASDDVLKTVIRVE